MSRTRLDITGERFGRLVAIRRAESPTKATKWLFKCDCGKEKEIYLTQVMYPHLPKRTLSCGCLNDELRRAKATHGAARNNHNTELKGEYKSWREMKSRCYNPNNNAYSGYGGRGITVCDRWLNSFENFLLDMGRRPSKDHSLDRYPNNATGNYEPTNCRWATWEQQNGNRRDNKWIEHNGERLIQNDWARKLGMSGKLFHQRLNRDGLSISEIENRYSKHLSA